MTPATLWTATTILLQIAARLALALAVLRMTGIIRPFKEMPRGLAGLAFLLLVPVTLSVHWAVSLLELTNLASTAELAPATEAVGNALILSSWVVIYVTVQTAATLFVFQVCGLAHAKPRYSELALLGAIILVGLLTTAIDSGHSYYTNPGASLREIARNSALLGIFALGATVVIISGGIDLSAGSTIAFAGTVCAAIMLSLAPKEVASLKPVGLPVVFAAILGTVAVGFLVGTLHAWLITSVRLPPFIATLATLVGLRSFARALCEYATATMGSGKSSQIYFNDPFFKLLRDHVCIAVAAFCVLAIITWIILNFTILGRHIYALGGNENAARLSGIRTDNVKWFAYCFAAFTAAIAAVFYVANVSVAAPVDQARGHELNAIAAAVVGGCSLQGGIGTVSGTILGAIFLRVVIDAVAKVIKTGADVYEGMIVGVVVVIAVTFSQIQQVIASGRKLLPGALGICAIPVLALLSGMMALMTLGKWAGLATGLAAIVLLGALKVYESSQSAAKN